MGDSCLRRNDAIMIACRPDLCYPDHFLSFSSFFVILITLCHPYHFFVTPTFFCHPDEGGICTRSKVSSCKWDPSYLGMTKNSYLGVTKSVVIPFCHPYHFFVTPTFFCHPDEGGICTRSKVSNCKWDPSYLGMTK